MHWRTKVAQYKKLIFFSTIVDCKTVNMRRATKPIYIAFSILDTLYHFVCLLKLASAADIHLVNKCV